METLQLLGLSFFILTFIYLAIIIVVVKEDFVFTGIGVTLFYILYLDYSFNVMITAKDAFLIVFSYIGIGVLYSFFKWYYLCKERYKKYIKKQSSFFELRGYESPELATVEVWNEWKSLEILLSFQKDYGKLQAKDYKEKILNFIIYWPLSFVFLDLLNNFVVFLYDLLSNSYDNLSNYVYKDSSNCLKNSKVEIKNKLKIEKD